MGKIYENDRLYSMLRYYVDYCIRTSYRETTVCGQENIPEDGAVIIAPNHCNTLMDALVVLRARSGATVFGARADLFRKYGKPLTFCRIVPMVRKRDGIREVAKNIETNEKVVEVLENDIPFCIFSEGTHRPKHSLLPITKGIARIALAANEKFGERKAVYIVPAGIEYGDYFRFRSTSLLQYGKPINVTEFVKAHPDWSEAQLQMELRRMISENISKLITYIPDDEKYDSKWTLARILACGRKGNLRRKLQANKDAIKRIEQLWESEPEKMESLSRKALEFEKDRLAQGVSMLSFESRPLWLALVWKSLAFVAGLPLFFHFALTCLPTWLFSEGLNTKVKDKAFHNTVHFASKVIFTPLVTLLWAIVYFCTIPGAVAHSSMGFLCPALGWIIPLALSISVFFGQNFIYDFAEFSRIWLSDWKLAFKKKLRREFKGIRDAMK